MVLHAKEFEEVMQQINNEFTDLINNKDNPNRNLIIDKMQIFLTSVTAYRDLIDKSQTEMDQLVNFLKDQNRHVNNMLEDISTSIEILSAVNADNPANIILNRDSFIKKIHFMRDGFNAKKMLIELFFEEQPQDDSNNAPESQNPK
jgi:hypothetical protein